MASFGGLQQIVGSLAFFMYQYRVCILYGDYVDLFERVSDIQGREFKFWF